MFLVDTNIISADSPTKQAASFAGWMRSMTPRLHISTVTVAEIERGIARCDRIQATTKAARLRQWLTIVERLYAGSILSFDIQASRHAGRIMDTARAHSPGFADIAIAAIAAAHGLTLLTANMKHFQPLGIPCLNPFVDPLPPP